VAKANRFVQVNGILKARIAAKKQSHSASGSERRIHSSFKVRKAVALSQGASGRISMTDEAESEFRESIGEVG
jgi:hypothetical protein